MRESPHKSPYSRLCCLSNETCAGDADAQCSLAAAAVSLPFSHPPPPPSNSLLLLHSSSALAHGKKRGRERKKRTLMIPLLLPLPRRSEKSPNGFFLFSSFLSFSPSLFQLWGEGGSFSRKGTRGVFGPWKIASKHAAALLSGSWEETLLISGFDLTTRLLLHLPCLMYILFLPIPSILRSGQAWIRFLPPSSKEKRREREREDILLSPLPATFEFGLRSFSSAVSSFYVPESEIKPHMGASLKETKLVS